MSRPRRRLVLAAACLSAGLLVSLSGSPIASAEANVYKTPGRADGATPPIVLAKAWLVADADTGEVLAAKNEHERLRPASTLKTLTAVTLLPQLNKDDVYKVSWNDAATVGSAVGIVPGATYTIDQLFYGMLLPSGNDAASALASAAGGRHKTVAMMNDEAARLGADDTTAVNPTGLDANGQYTSAFDLAVFGRAGLQREDFCHYVGTTDTSFPAEMPKKGKKRKSFMIYNQNPLLMDGYRGTLGVKTGYTTLAGATYVGAVERGGHTYIVTLMGLAEPTEGAAERLFNWTFQNADQLKPLDNLLPMAREPKSAMTPAAAGAPATPPAEQTSEGLSSIWAALALLTILGIAAVLLISRRSNRQKRPSLPRIR